MSTFKTAGDVLSVITATDDTSRIRGENRVKINNMANGVPSLTDSEAKQLGVRINVEWGEMAQLFAHARRQYENALFGMQYFFRVDLPNAPEAKRQEWSMYLTQQINRPMKKSAAYDHLKRSQIAQLVAHGIGPQNHCDADDWVPELIALEDLRVATDTETSFRNLEWYAVRRAYSVTELTNKVFGKNTLPGWNKPAIRKLLQSFKGSVIGEVPYDWDSDPEKMAELVKQNGGFYSSDALPTIQLWDFYYEKDGAWYLCVVPGSASMNGVSVEEFLYKSDKPQAEKLDHLLHCQFGDLSTKAPFLFWSVRSLGSLLIEPCFFLNLTRCRLLQHVHEDMNVWYRVNDPTGRARATKIDLFNMAVVPEGVSVVPRTERHSINGDLALTMLANITQLKNEAAVTYTQQLDTGTQKEQTATETMANVHRVNAMMEGLLSRFFRSETYAYHEIARRFCRKNSTNNDVQKFQRRCLQYGIPPQLLDVDQWDIEPETPMGNGNPTMAMAKANQLLQMRPMFNASAQQEILHQATVVFAGPKQAARWAPVDGLADVTDAKQAAEFAFGTLMEGVMVQLKQGLSMLEQAQTLIGMMAGKVASIEQRGNMAEWSEVTGLRTVEQYVRGLVAMLGQDPAQKPVVKQIEDVLGKLMNSVKGFEQRLMEQQQQGNGQMDSQAMAKIQANLMSAQVKAQTKEQSEAQKRQHKEISFQADEQRKTLQTMADIRREGMKAHAEVKNQAMRDAAQPAETTTTEE